MDLGKKYKRITTPTKNCRISAGLIPIAFGMLRNPPAQSRKLHQAS